MLRCATLRRRWSGRCGRHRGGGVNSIRPLGTCRECPRRASCRPAGRGASGEPPGEFPRAAGPGSGQVGPGGDAGPRQFGGGNAQGPGTAHDDIEAVAQSTDPFDPRVSAPFEPRLKLPADDLA